MQFSQSILRKIVWKLPFFKVFSAILNNNWKKLFIGGASLVDTIGTTTKEVIVCALCKIYTLEIMLRLKSVFIITATMFTIFYSYMRSRACTTT
jgi:hypothetical protein